MATTRTFVSFRKSDARFAPRTDGVDVTTQQYRDLVAAGWIPVRSWTATEVAPGHTILTTIAL